MRAHTQLSGAIAAPTFLPPYLSIRDLDLYSVVQSEATLDAIEASLESSNIFLADAILVIVDQVSHSQLSDLSLNCF
jgi:hypothetical protein